MTCEIARERIFEGGEREAEVLAHIAGCGECRQLVVLDERLERVLRAPEMSLRVREGILARVKSEKRRRWWELTPVLIGPGAGLAAGLLGAVLVPEMGGFLLGAGVVLGAAELGAHVLFAWMVEELGE